MHKQRTPSIYQSPSITLKLSTKSRIHKILNSLPTFMADSTTTKRANLSPRSKFRFPTRSVPIEKTLRGQPLCSTKELLFSNRTILCRATKIRKGIRCSPRGRKGMGAKQTSAIRCLTTTNANPTKRYLSTPSL